MDEEQLQTIEPPKAEANDIKQRPEHTIEDCSKPWFTEEDSKDTNKCASA
jgi:hypothetical protein